MAACLPSSTAQARNSKFDKCLSTSATSRDTGPTPLTPPSDEEAGGKKYSRSWGKSAWPGPSRKVQERWSSADRACYLASSGIVLLPGEEPLLHFLKDAIGGVPLPSPWAMHRDEHGRVFFVDTSAGRASWSHPLTPSLKELAGVCRLCLSLSPAARRSRIASMHERWQREASAEWAKWYVVRPNTGQEYFCHRETGESMWEHPAEALLPAHYLKIKSIQRLGDEAYVAELRTQPAWTGAVVAGTVEKEERHQVAASSDSHQPVQALESHTPGAPSTGPAVSVESGHPATPSILCIRLHEQVLGGVEVGKSTTLADVRTAITVDEIQGVPESYRFLFGGAPVSHRQESRRRAADCLPAVAILPGSASAPRCNVLADEARRSAGIGEATQPDSASRCSWDTALGSTANGRRQRAEEAERPALQPREEAAAGPQHFSMTDGDSDVGEEEEVFFPCFPEGADAVVET